MSLSARTDTFSVDPGVPFVAGVASALESDEGSESAGENERSSGRFVGGFVSRMRDAVTGKSGPSRGDRLQDERPRTVYPEDNLGHGTASRYYADTPYIGNAQYRLEGEDAGAEEYYDDVYGEEDNPPFIPSNPQSLSTYSHSYPSSESTIIPGDYRSDLQPQLSAESAILVHPAPASDYARMSMDSATPPPSDAALRTYFSRVKDLAQKISEMPWMAQDRVTADYYPEGKSRESKELFKRDVVHLKAVSWKSKKYVEWQKSRRGRVTSSRASTSTASSGSIDTNGTLASAAVIEPFPFTQPNTV